MAHNNRSTNLLSRALLGNAMFSTACGLVLLTGARALSPVFGVPTVALWIVGASLLPFAFGLFRNARRAEVDRREASLAVALDLGWVLGSAALVLGNLWPLTIAGKWAVAGVADGVLVFAVLQAIGLWRSRPAATSSIA